ncbi:ragulator complex protein LAMTOR3 homolog [Eurosta solidaginis]|uniref:ragulator complex protein LAMTOR3 homolog n=1 Tax=Eurosta solidaginis TaxID=178769 RepID=UPI003530BA34
MTDEVKKYFNSILNKVNGLFVIQVTDRDGVPLLRVSQDKNIDFALMPSFIPTFATASEQAGKLGLGRNKVIISMYSNYQVVQMNKLPLVLTFVGAEHCNTGHILALEKQLDTHLEDLKIAVTEV